ncbi:MAG: chemotaxis protein CheR [Gammaproteobacteria bacterium]|nr:chemotaxis protein CheR [Rhodocyclaceae bacterium]MBU3910483.1 chemotaxis protein CheR [Gammaproteobacteria bacterium]MBU3990135.1 chemotaxis protein CheR [Gammaproteobacteria bacterium]MBU4004964.1 chemotaxis protein CheR [Gammaproteobacteria bacterium]MBU4020557.1 chemotaxis protein CheR [Gammaproteobacteria bacterium]
MTAGNPSGTGGTAPSVALPSSLGAGREFQFTVADFDRVRQLIHKHAGISLAPIKQDMVYSRLARRLRALNMASFDQYLAYLEQGHAAEWETFVNSLTTNLTSFFRESHHFEMLQKHLLRLPQRPIRIWCSAASTGEEPYSLAITACEAFNSLTPPVQIHASDIDTNVLKTAASGVYPIDRVERLDPERLRKFFLKGAGVQAGQVRVRPELQKLITYSRINLLDAQWPSVKGPLDVLFCRNVMIYFDKPTQYQILKKFVPLLHPEGLLYAGHSESFLHATDLFRSLGRTVYERADRRGAKPGTTP